MKPKGTLSHIKNYQNWFYLIQKEALGTPKYLKIQALNVFTFLFDRILAKTTLAN